MTGDSKRQGQGNIRVSGSGLGAPRVVAHWVLPSRGRGQRPGSCGGRSLSPRSWPGCALGRGPPEASPCIGPPGGPPPPPPASPPGNKATKWGPHCPPLWPLSWGQAVLCPPPPRRSSPGAGPPLSLPPVPTLGRWSLRPPTSRLIPQPGLLLLLLNTPTRLPLSLLVPLLGPGPAPRSPQLTPSTAQE